jgi:HEAT repeat protein
VYPDRIEREYRSRAHQAPELYRWNSLRERESAIGEPLNFALVELARDEDPDIRRGAIRMILHLRESPATAPAFINALEDPDPAVRACALHGITQRSQALKQEALPQLMAAARDAQLELSARDAAYNAVREVDAQAAMRLRPGARIKIPLLVEQLTHGHRSERAKAARELGKFGETAAEAIPALVAAVEGPDHWVGARAADALGSIGPAAADAVPPLIEALASEYVELEASAARALGRIGPAAEDAVPSLLKMLEHDHSYVRVPAAVALWRIDQRTDVVVPVLREGLTDTRMDVRREAEAALASIESK